MTREINRNEVGNEKLDKIVQLSLLFDFYGELLKDHKKQIFEDYVLNDLSLGEIAEEQGISRQGVYDLVKRCSKELADYESKLGLVQKFEHTKNQVNRIKAISKQIKEDMDTNQLEFSTVNRERMDKIEKISEDILKHL